MQYKRATWQAAALCKPHKKYNIFQMTPIEKKRKLEKIIEHNLLPMIDRDYVLYGLPYYNNIGDSLIWDGELELLKKVRGKCVGVCGWDSYPNKKLPEDVIILITGGGYFGDIWRDAWQNVLDGIAHNKNNTIIILPNTIYYTDETVRDNDAAFLSQFPNLTICARDKSSFEYAKRYFSNNTKLVPDMAFCMSERTIRKWARKRPDKETLLFKRIDKECPKLDFHVPEYEYDVQDWLPMEKELKPERYFKAVLRRLHYLKYLGKNAPQKALDSLYKIYYRRLMTRLGLEQLSSYSKIYTTRLHAMILGVMLGRKIVMIDNSYGKLSSFYDTWLTDCDNVEKLN